MNKPLMIIMLISLSIVLFAEENQYFPIRISSEIESIIEENINKYNITNDNEIFPIGWSSDGKFAYIEYLYKQGKPVLAYRLVIQNLITDQILWNSEFLDVYELGDPYTDEEKEEYKKLDIFLEEYNLDLNSPEFFYQYKMEEIDSVLNQYNIVQSNSISIKEFPEKIEDITFDANRIITEIKDKSETYDNIINDYYSYNIEITKSGTEKKTIHSNQFLEESIIDSQIIGFIKSPFENRIVVILSVYRWDHHIGHNISYTLIGCDLNYGFK